MRRIRKAPAPLRVYSYDLRVSFSIGHSIAASSQEEADRKLMELLRGGHDFDATLGLLLEHARERDLPVYAADLEGCSLQVVEVLQ